MESFFSRYRNALVLIGVLLAQVIGLAVQVRRPGQSPEDKGGVLLIRAWVTGLVAPPERVLRATGSGLHNLWMNYVDLIHVRSEDKDLHQQLDRLKLEEASLAEDARQGERLQALLGFQEKYVYKTVAAQVIGNSGTEQSRVLLIDKGSSSGIHPDMPVITPDGIVGKTRDVFAHSSQVLEISDPTSGAGVILQNTRIRGVLRGNSWGQPEIVNVSPDDRIKAGEPVLTSGGDAIFPRGLAAGVVDRVVPDPDGTLVNVLIRPAANLSRLDEVLVITSTGSRIPSSMQEDLNEAQQKASEILAERLPSRMDPNAIPSDQDNADSTVGPDGDVALPMRPPQALHPDRYTPSDTPPAADLRPGQPIEQIEPPAATADSGAPAAVHSPADAAGLPSGHRKPEGGSAQGEPTGHTATQTGGVSAAPDQGTQKAAGNSGNLEGQQRRARPAGESGATGNPTIPKKPAAGAVGPEKPAPAQPSAPAQSTPPQGAA